MFTWLKKFQKHDSSKENFYHHYHQFYLLGHVWKDTLIKTTRPLTKRWRTENKYLSCNNYFKIELCLADILHHSDKNAQNIALINALNTLSNNSNILSTWHEIFILSGCFPIKTPYFIRKIKRVKRWKRCAFSTNAIYRTINCS